MGALEVDIRLTLGDFTLEVAHAFPLTGVTAVFGASGSGKSTLLRVIAGLERRATGRVRFNGTDWQEGRTWLAPERRGVGYVFQDTRLFPHLSVRGNLEYARHRARGMGGPGFDEVVGALDLGRLLPRGVAGLSGGEKQRVAIARALLAAPGILLLDEPLAALDAARKAEILPLLEQLRDLTRVPMIHVSHSVTEVARLARDVVVLRDGRVLRSGQTARMLADPDAVEAIGRREAGAVLVVRVVAHDPDGLTRVESSAGPIWLPQVAAAPGATLRLRILAHDVILSRGRPEGLSALNILPATIVAVRQGGGPGALIQLRLGQDAGAGDLLLARVTRRSAEALGLAPGVACHVIVKSVAVAQGDVGVSAED